jgi:hypothetical protein
MAKAAWALPAPPRARGRVVLGESNIGIRACVQGMEKEPARRVLQGEMDGDIDRRGWADYENY